MHAPFYFKARKIENPSPKSLCNICLLSEIHIDFSCFCLSLYFAIASWISTYYYGKK